MKDQKQAFVQGFVNGFNDALNIYSGSFRVVGTFGKVLTKYAELGRSVLDNRELRSEVTTSVTALGEKIFDEGVRITESFVGMEFLKSEIERHMNEADLLVSELKHDIEMLSKVGEEDNDNGLS